MLLFFIVVAVAATLVKSQLFKQIHFTFAARIFVAYLDSNVAAFVVVVVVMLLVFIFVSVLVVLNSISCSFIV